MVPFLVLLPLITTHGTDLEVSSGGNRGTAAAGTHAAGTAGTARETPFTPTRPLHLACTGPSEPTTLSGPRALPAPPAFTS